MFITVDKTVELILSVEQQVCTFHLFYSPPKKNYSMAQKVKFKYGFTLSKFNGSGLKAINDKKFALYVIDMGVEIDGKKTFQRKYHKPPQLTNPNYKTWNLLNDGKFADATQDAIKNNEILSNMLKDIQFIIDTYNPANTDELFKLYDNKDNIKDATKPITLGGFLGQLVNKIKNERKSNNYQVYNTLLSKLKQQPTTDKNRFFDIPLNEINNSTLKDFTKYVIEKLHKSNAKNLISRFVATVNKAVECELIQPVSFTYKWRKYIEDSGNNRLALSKNQLQQIIDLQCNGSLNEKENLYLDTCLLMYYLMCRPADIIAMHTDNIKGEMFDYIPYKKRGLSRKNNRTLVRICPQARQIIEKYKNQSKYGYVLPLPMNLLKRWDFTDKNQYKEFAYRLTKTDQSINRHLKKIGELLKLDSPLQMYTFRHTAITDAINKNDTPTLLVAKMAGTSVEMIEDFYYDAIQTVSNSKSYTYGK